MCSLRLAANRWLILLQIEGAAVDAVAQPGRVRSVREYVPQVPAAVGAADLGADHAVRGVGVGLHVGRYRWLKEARPPRAGLELRVRAEQLCATPGAAVGAIFLDIPVLA